MKLYLFGASASGKTTVAQYLRRWTRVEVVDVLGGLGWKPVPEVGWNGLPALGESDFGVWVHHHPPRPLDLVYKAQWLSGPYELWALPLYWGVRPPADGHAREIELLLELLGGELR